MTTDFASHNLGQVKRLASRVIYLERGQLLADLPVHDFFNGPLPQVQAANCLSKENWYESADLSHRHFLKSFQGCSPCPAGGWQLRFR